MQTYHEFIQSKIKRHPATGFDPSPFTVPLFPFQEVITGWAIRQGRGAIFSDCGTGKSAMQLEWAHQVCEQTGGNVLILAPLAVAAQTVDEGNKFGVHVTQCRENEDIRPGVNITNYDRVEKFDLSQFAGIVLDESSILKAFEGKTRRMLTDAFHQTPYRLCCTATPAPNDYTELGQHAEFLGVCSAAQMLATYFVNDTFDTGDWRLKGHARQAFWQWVASWAACVRKPSDLGFSDEGYILPPLNLQTITVQVDQIAGRGEGELFRCVDLSATTLHKEKRETTKERAEAVATLANNSKEEWLIFCDTNYEADALKAAIPEAIEVRGSDSADSKEKKLMGFARGEFRILISKPEIAGLGMNFQQCRNVAFVGLSYSFEKFYQALRRSYRFGQKRQVNAYIVQAETEGAILATVRTKMEAHEEMTKEMQTAAQALKNHKHEMLLNEDIKLESGDGWTMYHGDCVRVASTFAPDSIGFSVFSPPFADLFTYSGDVADMGNCADLDEFMAQFEYLIDQLMRVTMPGRECAVHCLDLLATKWKDGDIELKDFSGRIVTAFREKGWLFHSRITIWKDPVVEMQRTKAHGLLYKTLRNDSSNSRTGVPEYLLIFRKPGINPDPITHTPEDFPLDKWQELASPVWMTIDQGRVLNGKVARESQDERHICPLQLDVIERALTLWSKPGDLVFSPFAGIGSEGVSSIKMGRKFVGAELKENYWRNACDFIKAAYAESFQLL